jgi:hypothetical protein
MIIESDLPDVWVNLDSNGGKRDQQIIEATFREMGHVSRNDKPGEKDSGHAPSWKQSR